MPVINPAFVTKSVELAAPYSAFTFNRHSKFLFGSNVVIRGFFLKSLDSSGTGLTIKIGPGAFLSNGIYVEVNTDTDLVLDFTPENPYLIYGFTENPRDPKRQPVAVTSSDVIIDLASAENITPGYSIIGEIAPATIVGQHATSQQLVRYVPFAHHSVDEVVSDVKGGIIATESFRGDALEVVSGGTVRAKLTQGPLSLAFPNAIVWANGTYLTPSENYTIESPESITTDAISANSDVLDVIVSDDIKWQITYPFSFTGTTPNITVFPFVDNEANYVRDGRQAVLVFGNGLLLSPTRFRYSSDRLSVQILPNGSNQWVDAAGNSLSSISIVGVQGLRAYESLGVSNLPAVVNAAVGDAAAIKVPVPYFPASGMLQIFCDGKIAAVNRGWNAILPSTPFPDTFYVRESAAGSFELAKEPITASENNPPPSWTEETVTEVVMVSFDASYRNNVYYVTQEAPNAFQYLDDILGTGIYEAVFDTRGLRAGGSSGASVPEFAESPPGQNPFITLYDIIGKDVGNAGADPRDVTILRYANLDYLGDVPNNLGSAVSAAYTIQYGASTLLGNASGFAPRAKDSDGNDITQNSTVTPDKWYSSRNPVMTLAGLDNYNDNLFRYLGVFDRNFQDGGQAGANFVRFGGDLAKIGGVTTDSLMALLKKTVDLVGDVTITINEAVLYGILPTPCVISLETGQVKTIGAGRWLYDSFIGAGVPNTNFFADYNAGRSFDEQYIAAVFGTLAIQRPDVITAPTGFPQETPAAPNNIGAGPGNDTNQYIYGPNVRTWSPYTPNKYSERATGKVTANNIQVMLSPATIWTGIGNGATFSSQQYVYYHFMYDDGFGPSPQNGADKHFCLYVLSHCAESRAGAGGFVQFWVRGPTAGNNPNPSARGFIPRRNMPHVADVSYRQNLSFR